MKTLQQLTLQAFCSNFMLYYVSHVAHVNIVGRNFYSDHKLLGKIYEDAQGAIDTYAEILRTLECEMPYTLTEIMMRSEIGDISVNPDDFLSDIYEKIETQIELLIDLCRTAEQEDAYDVANFAASRMEEHKKQCYMLRSTLNG